MYMVGDGCFSFHIYVVYVWCMYVFVWVCAHVCGCIERLQVMLDVFPNCPHHRFWDRPSGWIRGSLIWLDWLDNKLWGSTHMPLPPLLETHCCTQLLRALWDYELRSVCLCDTPFTNSHLPDPIFFFKCGQWRPEPRSPWVVCWTGSKKNKLQGRCFMDLLCDSETVT